MPCIQSTLSSTFMLFIIKFFHYIKMLPLKNCCYLFENDCIHIWIELVLKNIKFDHVNNINFTAEILYSCHRSFVCSTVLCQLHGLYNIKWEMMGWHESRGEKDMEGSKYHILRYCTSISLQSLGNYNQENWSPFKFQTKNEMWSRSANPTIPCHSVAVITISKVHGDLLLIFYYN